jgi:hypothetical protein
MDERGEVCYFNYLNLHLMHVVVSIIDLTEYRGTQLWRVNAALACTLLFMTAVAVLLAASLDSNTCRSR